MAEQQPLHEACAEVCAFNRQNPGWPDLDLSDWALIFRVIADEVVPEHLCYAIDSWDAGAIAYGVIRNKLLDAAKEAEGGQ